MEVMGFTFWEAAKIIGLVFLGLVSTKAVAALRESPQITWAKPALYALPSWLWWEWARGNPAMMWPPRSTCGVATATWIMAICKKAYSNAAQAGYACAHRA